MSFFLLLNQDEGILKFLFKKEDYLIEKVIGENNQ